MGDPNADVEDLLAYLDASPSPWHAVRSAADRLLAAGFVEQIETSAWTPVSNGFVIRGGAIRECRRSSRPNAGLATHSM